MECCELGELHSTLLAGNLGRGPFGGNWHEEEQLRSKSIPRTDMEYLLR